LDLREDLISLVCLVLNAIALVRCRKSENMDAMNGGVVGVFIAPTTKLAVW
jgi:flagellar biosynthesis regulator FlaF